MLYVCFMKYEGKIKIHVGAKSGIFGDKMFEMTIVRISRWQIKASI